MKKLIVISTILFLILFTAFIKNSTKRIDDEIFAVKENINILKNEFNDLKLEYAYLTSGKRLMKFNLEFFKEDLITKSKNEIQIINKLETKDSE